MPTRRFVILLVVMLVAGCSALTAEDIEERGVQLFMQNRPAEAVPVLEQVMRQSGYGELIPLYLGIAYLQLNRPDDALAAFRKGVASAPAYAHVYHYNIGNTFFMQNRNSFALEAYSQALVLDDRYAPAYLNRANVNLRLGKIPEAVSDYGLYLALEPQSEQAAEIRRLLELLTSRITEAKQQEALAEARREAEAKAKADLMESVARSLLEAASDTTNLSAGSAGVEGYDQDFSLED